MKKKFVEPELDIILFGADVITSSQFSASGIYDVSNIWDAFTINDN